MKTLFIITRSRTVEMLHSSVLKLSCSSLSERPGPLLTERPGAEVALGEVQVVAKASEAEERKQRCSPDSHNLCVMCNPPGTTEEGWLEENYLG